MSELEFDQGDVVGLDGKVAADARAAEGTVEN